MDYCTLATIGLGTEWLRLIPRCALIARIMTSQTDRNFHGILAASLCLGALLRFHQIGNASFWLDEYTSLENASRTFGEILSGAHFDSHTPPFYYLALRVWLFFVPATEFGVRSFSAITDLINILLMAFVGRRFCGGRIGVTAAFLHAISPFSIFYAQEARMYSMLLFFVLVSLLFLSQTSRSIIQSGLMAVVGVCGLYTHYYYALFLAGVSIAWFFRYRTASLRTLTPLFVSGVGFLPWIKVVLSLASGPGQVFRQHLWLVLPYTAFRFIAGYGVLPLNMSERADTLQTALSHSTEILVYSLIGVVVLIEGMRQWVVRSRETFLLMGISAAIPVLFAVLISLRTPMLGDRYLIILLPLFFLLIANAFEGQSRVHTFVKGLFVASQLWGVVAMKWNPNFGKEQWRDAARFVSESKHSSQPIFLCPSFFGGVFRYYLPEMLQRNLQPCEKFSPAGGAWLIEHGLVYQSDRADFRTESQTIFPFENGIVARYVEPNQP